ncbi:MAG TPA: lysylphosphatidylglycerol synthase transmembrane domain-containing protein [Chloroflexota bacterium]|nr:lysylphosphatidylglycerol synthase transmembrane domain-containing protein [Chloroflexota bacterium]
MTIQSLTRKMLFSIGLGILVVFALSFSADAPRLVKILERFHWHVLPLVIGLTLTNYLLRFVKWHYYLRVIGIRDVPVSQSALIFVAGLSMAITPAKVGELLKSYLLFHHRGIAIGRSAPIIFAERLTDGVAMVILASAGLVIYGVGWQMLLPIVVAMVVVVGLSQHRGVTRSALGIAERMPLISSKVHHLEAALLSANRLFRLPNLVLAISIGVVSWGCESLAFYVVLTALGLSASPILAVQAAFILAVSSLVGAASMLPGGLAAAEGTLAGLLLLLRVTRNASIAAAATLIIRFCTLWLGVAVGMVGLMLAASQLQGIDLTAQTPPTSESASASVEVGGR